MTEDMTRRLHDSVRRTVDALTPAIEAGVVTEVVLRLAASPDELVRAFPCAERARHVYAAGLADGEYDEPYAIDTARVRVGRVELVPARLRRRPLEADEQLALSRQAPTLPAVTLPWERA